MGQYQKKYKLESNLKNITLLTVKEGIVTVEMMLSCFSLTSIRY